MAIETIAAVMLGALVGWMLLAPLARPDLAAAGPAFLEPLDPEETKRGIALIALKEIDFDRATGKLSDTDYDVLKARYAAEAVAAMREEEGPAASDPVEALIAERVRSLEARPIFCRDCGSRLEPAVRFCTACGVSVTPVG